MKIYNRKSELASWVHRKLGKPVIDVPLSDDQLDDLIDDACQYFSEHAGGIGNEQQYVIINVCEDRDHDNNGSIPSLEEGNCNEFDATTAAGSGFKIYQAEYQLPRNVIAIMQEFPGSSGGQTADGQLLSYGAAAAGVGAIGALGGGGGGFGYFLGGSSFGTRGGSRSSGTSTGIDMVGFEIGMQYLEMWRQRYTIKIRAQMLEQTRKVRFSPMPNRSPGGQILLGVWARVADEWLYENIWVKNYTLALAKLQVASNMKLYGNMSFPGGVTLNYEAFANEGKEEKKDLEQEIVDLKYGEPPDFIVA